MKQAALAAAQLQAAEQDLIVRVSQAYFDVLAARDSLTFVQAQKAAVSQQLAAAQRNFEVGTSTITDSREAQARYDLVLAQEIAAANDLRVKTLALSELVGRGDVSPQPLAATAPLPVLEPAQVQTWVEQALAQHPSLAQLRLALEVATLEVSKAQAGHLPTLDLTGSYTLANSNNNAAAGSTSPYVTRSNIATVGLSLNVPVFAGFSTRNRIKETLALQDKARTDLEAAQRTLAQGTRAVFFGVQSAQAQVRAYEAAQASSQSALQANELGYQVGVRINIDVLNSQSQLFDTQAKLAKARYDVLLGGLKLRQAAGVLQAADVQALSTLLQP